MLHNVFVLSQQRCPSLNVDDIKGVLARHIKELYQHLLSVTSQESSYQPTQLVKYLSDVNL